MKRLKKGGILLDKTLLTVEAMSLDKLQEIQYNIKIYIV